jgi:hypothetical protein
VVNDSYLLLESLADGVVASVEVRTRGGANPRHRGVEFFVSDLLRWVWRSIVRMPSSTVATLHADIPIAMEQITEAFSLEPDCGPTASVDAAMDRAGHRVCLDPRQL